MKIGYARVSSKDQNLDLQLDALKAYNCEKIFTDKGLSGKTRARPGLNEALATLQKGDTLVVYKLDRLFRSVIHFARTWVDFQERGIDIISITQGFDTSSSAGRLMMNILSSFAEFESDMISDRTKAGAAAAKKRGRKLGPRYKYSMEDLDKASRATYYRRRAKQ